MHWSNPDALIKVFTCLVKLVYSLPLNATVCELHERAPSHAEEIQIDSVWVVSLIIQDRRNLVGSTSSYVYALVVSKLIHPSLLVPIRVIGGSMLRKFSKSKNAKMKSRIGHFRNHLLFVSSPSSSILSSDFNPFVLEAASVIATPVDGPYCYCSFSPLPGRMLTSQSRANSQIDDVDIVNVQLHNCEFTYYLLRVNNLRAK